MLGPEIPYRGHTLLPEGEILEVIDPTQERWWRVKLSDGAEISKFLL
jgi:hypothetical protein